MAKKKKKPQVKKSNRNAIYAGMVLLVIVALAAYFITKPATPKEKLPLLFTWEDVPGKDSSKLVSILEKSDASWVRNAIIKKSGKEIIISDGEKNLSLSLNQDNTRLMLKSDSGRTQEFTVKNENGRLNIYSSYTLLNKPSTYEPGKVKITEFLKFNCGHCNILNPKLPALKEKYGDQIEITYKPMLWRTIAQELPFKKSIEAYILAARMGKGEEMKDALFRGFFVERKDITSEIVLGDIARSTGLGDEFIAALKKGDAKDEAEENIVLAESFQVDETPTIIINGNIKITPGMTNEDMAAMTENLNFTIISLLG